MVEEHQRRWEMSAYVLFIRESPIRNQAEIDVYHATMHANQPEPKPKLLAVYGPMESLEGISPDGIALLEFATMEDARTWYYGAGYQAAIPHRKNGADYRAVIVQGRQGAPDGKIQSSESPPLPA
jgi:uncharacterized protein (DUF1330 family)